MLLAVANDYTKSQIYYYFQDQKQEPLESRAFLGLASAVPEAETETLWRLYGQLVTMEIISLYSL